MSPFKSTITTSLGHWYLDDIAKRDPDAVIIRSGSNKVSDPHLLVDSLFLTVVMAEAMDNSYLPSLMKPSGSSSWKWKGSNSPTSG